MDEHEGNVNVNVEVKVGSLQKDVVISFSTSDVTAVGKTQNCNTLHVYSQ